MKNYGLALILFTSIAFFSCKQEQKEDKAVQEMVEKIDSLETEVQKISEEVEENRKDLEEALIELDSL